MSIITSEFIELFKGFPSFSQAKIKDPLVVAKLFDNAGTATWYLTEYDSEHKIAHGYVTGLQFDEWGNVYIPELEAIIHPILKIPRIERDLNFTQKPISQCVPALKSKGGEDE